MDNQKNKNTQAVAIGFLLIFMVGAATYLRNFSFHKKTDPVLPAAEKSEDQNTVSDLQKASSQELSGWMAKKEKVEIIDLRTADEFKAEHIIGSINIPLDDLGNNLDTLNKDAKTVFLDASDAPEVQQYFSNFFHTNSLANFYLLEGGFADWKSQFFPTISAGNFDSFTDRAKVTFIDTDQLKKIMEQEKNLLILDVRQSGSFAEGHLKGAVNLFLDDLEKKRDQLPVGKKIITYDNDGQWAYQAAVRLFDLGYSNVFSLSDGLDTWKKKNYEVVK